MVAERDGSSFAAQAGDLLKEIADGAREWRERCQNAFGGASTEATLLDTDTFLGLLEEAGERWRQLDPPAERAGAHADVARTLDDLRARLDELVASLDAGEPERVRVAVQAVGLSLDELEAFLPSAESGG